MTNLDEVILQRMSQSIPPNQSVTPRTTPIVFFGEYKKASACTISINPSHCEFYSRNKLILKGNSKRFISREELRRNDFDELSLDESEAAIDYCTQYFKNNPYKSWFDKYEKFLNAFDLSYYDGSVVHLDLVQWATTPLWSSLQANTKNALLQKDLPFMKQLLEKNFDKIFLNGITVVSAVENTLELKLDRCKSSYTTHSGSQTIDFTIYSGHYKQSEVIGWSPYLQSTRVPSYADAKSFALAVKDKLIE